MSFVANSDDLVEELARLQPEDCERVMRKAKAQRKRRIRVAIGEIRRDLLPSMSGREAARVITAAVNGGITRGDPVPRRVIVARLEEQLGCLDDLPGESAIRQMFRS